MPASMSAPKRTTRQPAANACSAMAPALISGALLRWYDVHARDLPWRVGPSSLKRGARGKSRRPDPYRVWLSEVMLQQTTVATVRPRFEQFLRRWPDFAAMAAAPVEDILGEWAGLGYYARARNLHKCARAVAALGEFPSTEEELRALPGIGAYTAAAIAAIAFDRRAVVIDGNVERVTARLFAIETPMPKAKAEIKDAISSVWPDQRSGDFAQALMDLGATVCTPKNPDCGACPLVSFCKARARGLAAELPRKAIKPQKPTRQGVAYALINARGEVLFERRPDKGLLGGMLGLPGSPWTQEAIDDAPSVKANWTMRGVARHSFTHFHLELGVMTAPAPKSFQPSGAQLWLAPDQARLPTVMRKAVVIALATTSKDDED